ncbi:MAG: MFS transporter [Gemmatimonadetes bacterium]|nr:MFS transporter [Gemmatimonadota bacterium]
MKRNPDSSRAVRRPHYAWVVAAVTFVTLLAAAGVRSAPGVLMVPLEQEFGWSRATISLAVSVNLVLYGLMGPFAAAIMDRLGVRRTMLVSLAVTAAGVAATAWMTRPWQLVLLWGVVVGGGTGMTALVLGATVVGRWFADRRGLVMGVLTASTATGQLLFLPLLASVVERSGWRPAVLGVACVAAVVVPLVALLMRDRPADVGLVPYGGTEADAVDTRGAGNPAAAALAALRDGLRSRDFLLLAGTFFICGASTNGLIGTHLVPAAHDHGIPEVAAAGLLATMGVFDFFGTTLSGWLSDRWDNRRLLAWYYSLRGLSLVFLPIALAGPVSARWVFAVFYGLDWIATVPPTVRLTANAFGAERVGVMFGWVVAAHQLGAAAAAFGAGVVRTVAGDYQGAFWTSGALCLLAAGMALRVGAPRSAPAPAAVAAA